MAKTPEAKIRDKVLKYAHSNKIRTLRLYFGPGIQTSWPDDLYLIPGGVALFLEAKAPGKKPTKKQLRRMQLLEEADYLVAWYDSVEQGIMYIDDAMEINGYAPKV